MSTIQVQLQVSRQELFKAVENLQAGEFQSFLKDILALAAGRDVPPAPTKPTHSPGTEVEAAPRQPSSPMKLACYTLTPNPPPLVPARAERSWMELFPSRHAYRCLPLSIANTHGWEILSPASFSVHWSGGPEAKDITFTAEDGFPYLDHLVNSNFSRGILTFHTGYLFRTEPGWNLLATGPLNEPRDGVAPLTGIIETDWLPYPFTMNWQLTRPGDIRWRKGEPFCMIFPVPKDVLETIQPEIFSMDSEQKLKEQYVAWRQQRDEFMAKFRAGDEHTLKEAWQRYYFKGEYPGEPGKTVVGHKTKTKLAHPIDRRQIMQLAEKKS